MNGLGRKSGGARYGIGYLYMAYLTERFGEGIVGELIKSPDKGKANLDARLRAHGSSYVASFGDFAVALQVCLPCF